MAIAPRRLRPSELCRLVNSTPLGTVLDERQLHRHRTRAGFRIGDATHVDLFCYVARLAVAMGDRGCLSLFGQRREEHRLFAEHVTAEYRVKTEGRGRTVDEWKLRVSAGDNHWLDCLVGCAVAASIQGVSLPGLSAEPGKDRRRVSFAELQRRRKEHHG